MIISDETTVITEMNYDGKLEVDGPYDVSIVSFSVLEDVSYSAKITIGNHVVTVIDDEIISGYLFMDRSLNFEISINDNTDCKFKLILYAVRKKLCE